MNLATKLLDPNEDLAMLVSELFEEFPDEGSLEKLDRRFWDRALLEPARDILSRSGKGFRARLVESSWALAGGDSGGHPPTLPLLVELLHVGSLVIDDIEDDSPTRRGQPALHRRYGVPLALNTGNWLYFLPLALLPRLDLGPALTLALYEDITRAVLRSHQGQALDLGIRVTRVRQRELPKVVARSTRLKTGTLMELAARIGAHAAGCDPGRLEHLARFGCRLGVGLQMLDDWMGLVTPPRLPKGIEDIRLARPTWPWAWLAQECDEVGYADLVREAGTVTIDWEAERLIQRMRARLGDGASQRIRSHLDAALTDLETSLGSSPHLTSIRDEVDRLERAYG